jgi:hypothetical protein
MPYRFAKAAALANEYGIRSTCQLSVYLECAKHQHMGWGMYDIFNVSPEDEGYKVIYVAVRQLMLGAANRGYNGANVLTWGDLVRGKERAILLTPKGRRLLKVIEEIMAPTRPLSPTKD